MSPSHAASDHRFYRLCWWLAYALGGLLFRVRSEGRHHIPPDGGVVFAGNHCSYVDPVLIGVAAGRQLWYVTKREVFSVPLLGALLGALHAMPIDRSRGDRAALAKLERQLKAGRAVLMFPEGTRNKTGRFLRPKSGVGMAAYRAAVPVVPVYISGTVNVWATITGRDRVTIRFGAPMPVVPDEMPRRRRDAYKSISSEVMRKIDDLKRGGRQAGTTAPASVRADQASGSRSR